MTTIAPDMGLEALKGLCQSRLHHVFSQYLQDVPSLELKTAMEYTLLHSGKQLRPLLVYATGSVFAAPLENLDIAASAVEIMHTYSLIHDDLPCMDNADLRRGKRTCHKMYGEGMAVLTGDALQTLAMQIIANHPAPLNADRRIQMVSSLSQASGPYGMAAGQALDIALMNEAHISTDLLLDIYGLKTGVLFSACVELGRLASKDEDDVNQRALLEFSQCIGLAFQIQDDILDIEAPTATLGKEQGIDRKNNKATYPHLHGIKQAKDKVQSLYQEALDAIQYMGNKTRLLREVVDCVLILG